MEMYAISICLISGIAGVSTTVPDVEYVPGDLGSKIILIAPAGGEEEPSAIPDRDSGCTVNGQCVWSHSCGPRDPINCAAVTTQDVWTKEFAMMVAGEINTQSQIKPHLVLCNLHRKKLDVNREIGEAAFGVPTAEQAWNQFMGFIQAAKVEVGQSNTRGIIFDLRSTPSNMIELGYLLSSSELGQSAISQSMYSMSSIKSAASAVISYTPSVSFQDLIRGSNSLGEILQNAGYDSVPSTANPSPGSSNTYVPGGYITSTYGSLTAGQIDAIEIASPQAKMNSNDGPAYAQALAKAINKFMENNYN